MGASESVPQKSIHEFTVKDTKGQDVDLSIYKGKVLLVVNVASKWFFSLFLIFLFSHVFFLFPDFISKFSTFVILMNSGFTDSNYTQLTDLYNKFKDGGLEILAFPCNQFLKQEPGTSQEAQEFACTRYKAEYPIFQKVRVNGPTTEPVYKFLKSNKSGFLGSRIKWNFTKFLVDKDGHVLGRYSPITTPLAIEADIKKALGVDM
ncbi:hypothetical protein CRYUN_Cryun23aG0090800 [Craigia yunnanensis]